MLLCKQNRAATRLPYYNDHQMYIMFTNLASTTKIIISSEMNNVILFFYKKFLSNVCIFGAK